MENNARYLTSAEPLENRMLKIRYLYRYCLGCTAAGLILRPLFGIGILGFMVVYIIHEIALKNEMGILRTIRFGYGSLTTTDLFAKLQPILMAQYQGAILMERDRNQNIVFTYGKHMYDLIIHEDHTFSLNWRMSMGKALFSLNDYHSYRKLLIEYGILAYHIQKCSEETESKEESSQ